MIKRGKETPSDNIETERGIGKKREEGWRERERERERERALSWYCQFNPIIGMVD